MIDCQLFGLNAGAHHLVNVGLHTVTALLLFTFLRQSTNALWASAISAAIFAIHPLRVESVAWISERKDVLSGLFFMLTLLAYLRYSPRPDLATDGGGRGLFRFRFDVKTDAGDDADRIIAVGLLAI